MASALSVSLAIALHLLGSVMFMDNYWYPPCLQCPAIPTGMIYYSLYLILRTMALYPTSFRPVHWIPSTIVECFIAKFLLEACFMIFWHPIQNGLYTAFPILIQKYSLNLDQKGTTYKYIFENKELTQIMGRKISHILCYLCAISTLVTTLHATKTMDVELVSENGTRSWQSLIGLNFLNRTWLKLFRPLLQPPNEQVTM